MRARISWIGGVAVLGAAVFMIEACGDTDEAAKVDVPDAGDATTTDVVVAPEAASSEDAGSCDPSASFSDGIQDASIGDGASTSGLCLGCASTKCTDKVAACNASCACQSVAGAAIDCYLKDPSAVEACATPFLNTDSKTLGLGLALVGCVQTKCVQECAIPTDGGADDAGDGG